LTGYTKREVRGQKLTDCVFINRANRSLVEKVFERALRGIDCQNFEFCVQSKNNKRVELLLNAATRRNAAGTIMGVVGVGQDITEKKYIEKAQIDAAKMRAANDAKGNFLASMSHEMRTPLNGVLGMLQLVLSHELPAAAMQNVRNAYMSGEHLLNLVNDILDVSKIEAGKVELEEKPFNILEVFKAAADIVQPQAKLKNLALKLEVQKGFPRYARGDQQRVRQV
jgi:PAS domain S-box-containing protein|tara:strand:- start:39 stop:713 length:675 start_codon:yes stop_codon:yes gene_type:complete